MSEKLIYIADNMYPEFTGGAEINDFELLHGLEACGVEVVKYHSNEMLPKHVEMYHKRGYKFLLSNFMQCHVPTLERIIQCNYSLIEHDHKYLKTRDPSKYENFQAPASEIINRIIYANAKCVFAQSKKHKEIMEKNLNLSNIVNLGMSTYSPSQLIDLETLVDLRVKNSDRILKKACIVKSNNPTKNQVGSEQYCIENNIDYDIIGGEPTEEHPEGDHNWFHLMGRMSYYETLVFIPSVFETFNRVIFEARMLGLKVISTDLNGCMSEEWFSKYKGIDLINFSKSKVADNVLVVYNTMYNKEPDFKEDGTPKKTETESNITAILNAYRRPNNIKMQVEALRNQSIPPKEIWLWINAHEDNEGYDFSTVGVDKIFHNNHNWKFYGRFAAALLADTEYVAMYDDDTVPGIRWHQNCLETMSESEGILGSAGIILKSDKYMDHDRCGWPSKNPNTTEVDLVGHAWFFKREWLRYLWQEKPTTWDNGEDIQFAFMAKIHGGIPTYCPPHPPDDKRLWGSTLGNELGIDDKATSTNSAVSHQQFFGERDACVAAGLNKGWATVHKVKK
jgi:hypothetical protein